MKRLLTLLLWVLFTCLNSRAKLEWFTDVNAAVAKAKAENKTVVLDFTGSDWCGWCMKLKSEVYDNTEFADYAKANLVMVELDFPHSKPMSAELREANEQLQKKYSVEGFPTTILLNGSGEEIGKRVGYVPGGPKGFIAMMEQFPKFKHSPPVVEEEPPSAPRRPVEFVPIAPAVPNHYGELALKSVSGPKDRRIALINNESLMVGDTAKIKVFNGKVEVTCKEIREDSVLLIVDGKTKELKLAHSGN